MTITVGCPQTNRKTDTGKTLKPWPVLVDHYSLYVDEPYHGKGFAQALMQKCFAEFEAKGSDPVWLGVWEHNPRAISFYRKLGFTEVGEHIFQVGSDPQRDIIMKRSTYAS
ncbi:MULTISPECIES: N-acetyltransferase [Citrobacter freundii complex]|uniref:GNAT family N-acetyltransferase n=1 Tax=Citrobacter freundii complex TaxID=1344959 RepID=UPI002E12822B|nr:MULTISPECIES: N-acetyltransferase [Citrobacter freundii complex]